MPGVVTAAGATASAGRAEAAGTSAENAGFRAVARNRRFMSLWFAQIGSLLAANMALYALTLVAFSLGGDSSTAVSLLFLAFLAPAVLLSAPAGVFVSSQRYALSATLGSIGGCLLLYFIGKRGGDALVRSRFKGGAVDKALVIFRRYGIMAVLIPAILPPPAPFKIFVLLAGVAGITVPRFVFAIAIGRGFRYFAEGLLAVWYGEQAIEFIHANSRSVSIGVVGVLVAALAGYVIWSKAQARSGR